MNVKNTASIMIGLSLSSLVGTASAADMNKKTITPESMPAIVVGLQDSDYRTLNTEEMSQIVGTVALPTGQWNVIANGFAFPLNITSINAGNPPVPGTVTGTITAGPQQFPINGIYSDPTNQFAFIWRIDPTNPNATVVFNGHYYVNGAAATPNQMSGTFIAFGSAGGNATQNTFAWRADRPGP